MAELREFLESERQHIVDYIQGRYIPENITEVPIFSRIATELQGRFVHSHRGTVGGRDEFHNVLAMGIMCSMWCGWLSQAKANRIAYPKLLVELSKRAIIDAFEIGQEYSKIRR